MRTLTLFVVSLALAANTASAETLERELLKQAPAVVKHFQERGCKNIGVLKFRIKKGNDAVSDNVGTLNMFLAHRLEVAITLANDNKVETQLGIVKNASGTASRIAGANHTTEEGRQKLFAGAYRLAWGAPKTPVTVDGFITGVVLISPDLRDMIVGLMAFDRKSETLEKIATIKVPVDANILSELGESFVLRGAFDQGAPEIKSTTPPKIEDAIAKAKAQTQQIVQAAAKVREQAQTHPLVDPQSPVILDVLYDNRPEPVRIENGQALVAEPAQGQAVSFVLKRRGSGTERLAVVLKVNGESTLAREKLRDVDCRKWVLEPSMPGQPASPPILIRGFQKDDKIAEQFVVLSSEQSKQNEIRYGDDVGLISLTVFREQKPGTPTPPSDLPPDEAEDLIAMLRGVPSAEPKNLAALKQQLRTSGLVTRGLIGEGQQTDQTIRRVTFTPDPIPAMTASIRYYKP